MFYTEDKHLWYKMDHSLSFVSVFLIMKNTLNEFSPFEL